MALFVQNLTWFGGGTNTSFNQSDLFSSSRLNAKELPVSLSINGVSMASMSDFWVCTSGGVPNSDTWTGFAYPAKLEYVTATTSKLTRLTEFNYLFTGVWGNSSNGASLKCQSSGGKTSITAPLASSSSYIHRILASEITKDVVSGLIGLGSAVWLGFLNVSAPGRAIGAGITLAKTMPSLFSRALLASTLPAISDTFFNLYNYFMDVPDQSGKMENISGTRTVIPNSLNLSSNIGTLSNPTVLIDSVFQNQLNFIGTLGDSNTPQGQLRAGMAVIFRNKLEVLMKDWEIINYPDYPNDAPWFDGLGLEQLLSTIQSTIYESAERIASAIKQRDCLCMDKLITAIKEKDFGGGSSITSAELSTIFASNFRTNSGDNVAQVIASKNIDLDAFGQNYVDLDSFGKKYFRLFEDDTAPGNKNITNVINDKEIENSFVSLGGGDLFVD